MTLNHNIKELLEEIKILEEIIEDDRVCYLCGKNKKYLENMEKTEDDTLKLRKKIYLNELLITIKNNRQK